MSSFATVLTQSLLRVPIKDPLSGFYLLRREVYERGIRTASPQGFKILLELYLHGHPARVIEVPIHFRDRIRGKSKVSSRVLYLALLRLMSLVIAARSAARAAARS